MTERIDNTHSKYATLVDIKDPSEYIIQSQNLQPDEEVVCPFDKDTSIKKNDDGTLVLVKKCYQKNCFSK